MNPDEFERRLKNQSIWASRAVAVLNLFWGGVIIVGCVIMSMLFFLAIFRLMGVL